MKFPFLLLLWLGLGLPVSVAAPRPNVILIMVDDMGYSDIGSYGGEVKTPHLDQLAKEGMRFTSFCNNGKCEPTRATLLSGAYPREMGAGAKTAYRLPTFGEVMRPAGYHTLMAGKWHAGERPYDRGFDRHFGLTDGCSNHFNPGEPRSGEAAPSHKSYPRRWAFQDRTMQPYTPKEKDFYTTDAFTEKAIQFVGEVKGSPKPFILYLAYTAPHYPLHAWPEDIAKYEGVYDAGWEKIRAARWARQQELGILPPNAKLSPPDGGVPSWENLTDASRKDWVRRMQVYAAMIDRVDQNIGKLLEALKANGQLDNTLICFLSDNGGEAAGNDWSKVKGTPAGPLDSYRTVGLPWANVSNTPFRYFKTQYHEGGVSTPFIAWWPGKIEAGSLNHEFAHIRDIMPTLLDLGEGNYPSSWKGTPTPTLTGSSLRPLFEGKTRPDYPALCWRWGGSMAMREGAWKIVRQGKGGWELYHLADDPTELNNLAAKEASRTREMAHQWDVWNQQMSP